VNLKIFAIRDMKAECFIGLPWFNLTHAEAERNFLELAKDEKSMVSKYPDDFDLYHLGEYDKTTGNIIPLQTPNHMVKAAFIKSRNHAENRTAKINGVQENDSTIN